VAEDEGPEVGGSLRRMEERRRAWVAGDLAAGKEEMGKGGGWMWLEEEYLGPNFGLPHGLKSKMVRGKCNSRGIFSSKFCGVRGACWGRWI
jgi:hypothetical protein